MQNSRIFTDQTHSYTLATSIIRAELLKTMGAAALTVKLRKFAQLLDGAMHPVSPSVESKFKKYQELSAKQTTDASRRSDRDRLFVELLQLL